MNVNVKSPLRRALALLLIVVMVLGVLPAAVNAEGDERADNQYIETSKTVEYKDGQYVLHVESYLEGTPGTFTETIIPSDIVLVVDESGSMDDCVVCNENHAEALVNGEAKDCYTFDPDTMTMDTNLDYYTSVNNKVWYCEKCEQWFVFTKDSTDSAYKGDAHDEDTCDGTKTTRYVVHPIKEGTNQTDNSDGSFNRVLHVHCRERCTATKVALRKFLAEVYADATGNTVDHRVAIIGYGQNNNEYQVHAELQSIGSGYENLKTGVDAIKARNATPTHLGMQGAVDMLKAHPLAADEQRNRIVILFADGAPGSGYNISDYLEWVQSSITSAWELKNTYRAMVYSVGMFGAANANVEDMAWHTENIDSPTQPNHFANGNCFLQLVSSNFPSATSYKKDYWGELNPDYADGKAYYLTAKDETALNDAFVSIAKDVAEGTAYIKDLTAEAVTRDVVSESFQITDPSLVIAWTESYAGLAADSVTKIWTKDADSDSTTTTGPLAVSVEGQTVKISNFSYTDNSVRIDKDENNQDVPKGKKLVFEIPISAVVNGATYIETNVQDNSGIYNSNGAEYEEFELPHVDVPTAVIVTKKVVGTDTGEDFKFNASYTEFVQYKDEDGSTAGETSDNIYNGIDEQDPNSNYLETDTGKVASKEFSLGNGDSAEIANVIVGSTMTIGEIPGIYDVAITDGNGEALPVTKSETDGVYSATFKVVADMEIVFTNTNSQAVADSVVIDYGLPVDITVLGNDVIGGTVLSVALTSTEGTYGTAAVNGTQIRYTPGSMIMAGTDQFTYTATYKNPADEVKTVTSTVTVIPATTIYYEDTFVTFINNEKAVGDSALCGIWTQVPNSDQSGDVTQAEDRPGEASDAVKSIDADNVYGYDAAYASMSEYSMGTAKKISLNSTYNSAQAVFTFWGTGFDVVSLTSNTTGTIVVDIYDATQVDGGGNIVKTKTETVNGVEREVSAAVYSYIVDTYYGYTCEYHKVTYTYQNDEWAVASDEKIDASAIGESEKAPEDPDENSSYTVYETKWVVTTDSNALYQIPVMKVSGLDYGKYYVEIVPAYDSFFDNAGKGTYDVYVDAIRIYDPAGVVSGKANEVISDAYNQDGEACPVYEELRNCIIKAAQASVTQNADGTISVTLYQEDGTTEATTLPGAVFVDGKSSTAVLADYISYGPNNELYLTKDQYIGFKMNLAVLAKSGYDIADIQLGVKSANGQSVTYTIDGTEQTVSSATDMYYSIMAAAVKEGKEVPVVIKNTSNGILSLTNVKVTYTPAVSAVMALSVEETSDAAATSLLYVDAEVVNAVLLADAGEDDATETEPTEPEVEETEPETTEPEVEETEPETTEPEVEETEPETTEPEVEETEPEPTEPEDTESETEADSIISVVIGIIKKLFGWLFG